MRALDREATGPPAEALGQWTTSRAVRGQPSRETSSEISLPGAEEEFYEALRTYVSRVPPSGTRSRLRVRCPVVTKMSSAVVAPVDVPAAGDMEQPHIFDLLKAQEKLSDTRRRFEEKAMDRALREEAKALKRQFLGSARGSDFEVCYRQAASSTISENSVLQPNARVGYTILAHKLLSSLLPSRDRDDFLESDQLDWVLQHQVQAETGELLRRAEEELERRAVIRGTKRRREEAQAPILGGMFYSNDLCLSKREPLGHLAVDAPHLEDFNLSFRL
eukprot:284816208_3